MWEQSGSKAGAETEQKENGGAQKQSIAAGAGAKQRGEG